MIRCISCGQFCGPSQGATEHFEPDSDRGPEISEWTCRRCAGPATAMLTPERARERLSYNKETGDLTWLSGRRAGYKAGGFHRSSEYNRVNIDGVYHQAHIVAWMIATGSRPADQIDHLDLDKTNNRWSNLRPATRSQNAANRAAHRNKLFHLKGAYQRRDGNWFSSITAGGKQYFLGYHPSGELAHAAYAKAANDLHGEFARAA